ncbi:hypothetical protein EBR43_02335 [bacterium]|nr:hypothetical protein [bacterium]
MSKKTSPTKQKKSSKRSEADLELPPILADLSSVVAALTGEQAGPTPGKKLKPSEKPHYVNSKQFEEEIRQYYKTDKMTEYLADSIRRIAYGLSFAPNFINYSYRDEMIGDAVVKMYQALKYKKFKLDHGFSPFSYFTTIAFHAFISRIKKEKKHHQLIADYRERNYDSLLNKDEEDTGVRVYSHDNGGGLDNSLYNESNA